MHKRLKVKLLIVQMISIIPFLLFIFYIFDLWYDTRRSSVIEQNITQAKITAGFMYNMFLYTKNTADIITNDKLLFKLLSTDLTTSKQIIKNIADHIDVIDNITISDPLGKPIISSLSIEGQNLESINLSYQDYFRQAIETKKAIVSPPLTISATSKYVIIVIAPVLKEDEVIYITTLAIDINRLKEKLDQSIGDAGGKFIYVLDSNRQIIFLYKQPLPSETEKNLMADLPFVKKAQEEQLAVIENIAIPFSNNKAVMGGAVSTKGSGWVVVSVEPMETTLSPFFKIQSLIWLIVFVAFLFSASVISFFLRKVKIIY